MIEVNGVMQVGAVQDYINNEKALQIILGILLSIIIAFSLGAIIQWLSRLVFTFHYEKVLRYAGGIWGGLAITSIVYFLMIKGVKGASFMNEEVINYISENTGKLLIISFVSFSIFFQILTFFIKKFVLNIIVLIGTFALAMAFAGNDLVNFIGVPIAGLKSFYLYSAEQGANPRSFLMEFTESSVKTEWYLLAIAGFVMVITLWTSRKAKSVVGTTLDLSRQHEGEERFNSNYISRSIVRVGRHFGTFLKTIIPKPIKVFVAKRFENNNNEANPNGASFDLIRASVILIVSSIIISFATSLKLPLSTTYVTFMVAMGASLADKAWGRESAVYRISGVFSVIGGWFLTAFAAFTVAFIIAIIIHYGGVWMVAVFVAIAVFFVIRTHAIHKKITAKKDSALEIEKEKSISMNNIVSKCVISVSKVLNEINAAYIKTLMALFKEKRKTLQQLRQESKNIRKETQLLKSQLNTTLIKFEADAIENGHHYVQIIENLNELAYTSNIITKHVFQHIDNQHKGLIPSQIKELEEVIDQKQQIQSFILENLNAPDNNFIESLYNKHRNLLQILDSFMLAQIKRVKNQMVGKKNSLLYMNIISETKNLLSFEMNLMRAYHRFFYQKEII
jgi:hypothetical protein